jgi:hypothetical protein
LPEDGPARWPKRRHRWPQFDTADRQQPIEMLSSPDKQILLTVSGAKIDIAHDRATVRDGFSAARAGNGDGALRLQRGAGDNLESCACFQIDRLERDDPAGGKAPRSDKGEVLEAVEALVIAILPGGYARLSSMRS